jgi:hypothetical protein
VFTVFACRLLRMEAGLYSRIDAGKPVVFFYVLAAATMRSDPI